MSRIPNLPSRIELTPGNHRLHAPFRDFCAVNCSIALAATHIFGTDPLPPNGYFELMGDLFDVKMRLPLMGPIVAAANNVEFPYILVEYAPIPPRRHMPDSKIVDGNGLNVLAQRYVGSIFVQFFEEYIEWLSKNVSTDRNNWPEPWSFGRVVRNAIVHGWQISIDNPNASTTTWHGLSYGRSDNGKSVLNHELSLINLLTLMLEMSEKLDALGCTDVFYSPPTGSVTI